jgi:hypothetical protein
VKSVVELHFEAGSIMPPTKTLQVREKELQSLLANAAGKQQLHELASRYQAISGNLRPARASVITFILVHERERGLVS